MTESFGLVNNETTPMEDRAYELLTCKQHGKRQSSEHWNEQCQADLTLKRAVGQLKCNSQSK
jgi:hypothetical protein